MHAFHKKTCTVYHQLNEFHRDKILREAEFIRRMTGHKERILRLSVPLETIRVLWTIRLL